MLKNIFLSLCRKGENNAPLKVSDVTEQFNTQKPVVTTDLTVLKLAAGLRHTKTIITFAHLFLPYSQISRHLYKLFLQAHGFIKIFNKTYK